MSEEKVINGFGLPKTRTKKAVPIINLTGQPLSKEKLAELHVELKLREEENKANPPS